MSNRTPEFAPGDHIKITGGKYKGESGIVHHVTNFFVFFTYPERPSMRPAQAAKRFAIADTRPYQTTSRAPRAPRAESASSLENEVSVLTTLLIK